MIKIENSENGILIYHNNQKLCSVANALYQDNVIKINNITGSAIINNNYLEIKFMSDSFDILGLKFDSIKKINQNEFYYENNNTIYTIYCPGATLINNQNLIISVLNEKVFSIKLNDNSKNTNFISLNAPTVPQGVPIYNNVSPSFSITFYENFDPQTSIFSNRFESVNDLQIINTNDLDNVTSFFAEIIIDPKDLYEKNLLIESNIYNLYIYQYFNGLLGSSTKFNIYKIGDNDLGSIYYCPIKITDDTLNGIKNGTKFFMVKLSSFTLNKKYNFSFNISGGPISPYPSSSSATINSINSQSSGVCCYIYITQKYSTLIPYWSSLLGSPPASYVGTVNNLYDFEIPETTTYVAATYSGVNGLPLVNNQWLISIMAGYPIGSLNNFAWLNWQYCSLCFISYSDLSNSNINLNTYTVQFYYYFVNIDEPYIFTLCLDNTNSKIINVGANYFIQCYFQFSRIIPGLATDVVLNSFEVHLSKAVNYFVYDEIRIYDFKIYNISCSPQSGYPLLESCWPKYGYDLQNTGKTNCAGTLNKPATAGGILQPYLSWKYTPSATQNKSTAPIIDMNVEYCLLRLL